MTIMPLGRDCEFNHTEAFQCPFFSSGSFAVEERDSCPDFMQARRRAGPDPTQQAARASGQGLLSRVSANRFAAHQRAAVVEQGKP